MHWDGNARVLTSFAVDMMTAIDTPQFPALRFEEFAETLTADRFQTAISITLSFSETGIS